MGGSVPPEDMRARRAADWARVDAVFTALLDLPPEAREAALTDSCSGDEALATAVRRLLEAERRSAQAFDAAVTSVQRLAEHAVESGDSPTPPPEILEQIGPWQLIERLGAGGMSVVWRAERNDGQFQQTVAIKLLRRWIENDETVQRFRDERRILAGLEHPNLARLLDGGVVGDGWPYFVMECVDGLPITDYCDQHRLDIDARLALFRQVLEVVQYAHRRLVVHRDLKPSNILVTAEGRVKLLDFGIAKVLDREAMSVTDSELTELGGRPMTLAYASPEQVTGEPITTASDVYALGVLLYQLLTGRAPYRAPPEQPIRLREAVLQEIPTNPSTRILETGDGIDAEDLARRRSGTPARLARRLRGDLDVICQVALRKEADRRYATVAQLANDLDCHRRHLPVTARAGNWRYLAGRFVRRHAWAVAATVLIPTAALIGLALHAERLGAERDRAAAAAVQAEREATKARQVTDYLVSLFRAADPAQSAGRAVTAVELVERGVDEVEALADDPGLQAEMFRVLGQVSHALGRYPQAAELLLSSLTALDGAPAPVTLDRADVLADLGFNHFQMGRLEEAERYNGEALAALPPGDALRRAPVLTNLGIVYILTSRYADAEVLLGQAIDAHEAGAPGSAAHATTLNALGTLLSRQGRHPEAIAMLESATAMRRELFGELHPATSVAIGNLGLAMLEAGDPAGGEGYLLQALAIDEEVLGHDHPSVAVLLNQLGAVRRDLNDPQGSIPYLDRALAILRQHEGVDDASPSTAYVISGLGAARLRLGEFEAAAIHLEQAVAIWERTAGPNSREVSIDLVMLGEARLGQGRLDEAEALVERALTSFAALLDGDNPLIANANAVLAKVHLQRAQAERGLVIGD
jgi:eukaryotic-like serine/threonine-protein kinase